MIKDIDTIEVELQERVSSIARALIETIHSKTDDPENFITINEVESLLETALANTKLEYLEKMRECLSNVDESSIIKLKKESMPKGG